MQYERDICECVHRAAASRRTASARFGSTIRDSSSRQLNGRRNPADARPILRGEAMHLHRCKMRAAATTWRRRARAFRALRVGGAHPAGCDPFARKRPEKLTKAQKYRLNIPALGLRRVVSSGYLSPPLPLAADDKTHQQQPLKCRFFSQCPEDVGSSMRCSCVGCGSGAQQRVPSVRARRRRLPAFSALVRFAVAGRAHLVRPAQGPSPERR